jgi:hypothetical protein
MDYRIDPKGKVFTTHITKRNLDVVISLGNSIIQGKVYLMADNRLKDEMNDGERFIAVTDAQIFQPGSESPLYESAALIINKEQINWIFPKEPAIPSEEPPA